MPIYKIYRTNISNSFGIIDANESPIEKSLWRG